MRTLRPTLVGAAILVLSSAVIVSGHTDGDRPSVPVSLDTLYFVGTWTCDSAWVGVEYIDGVEHQKRHLTCTTESTNPRVVGTEELHLTRYGNWSDAAPWTADAVLSTTEGTWRGSGRGVRDVTGASGLGMARFPFLYGELTYVGEGAYDGLVMHRYMAGHLGNLAVSGWVTPAE